MSWSKYIFSCYHNISTNALSCWYTVLYNAPTFFLSSLTYLHLFQFLCHSNFKLDYLEQTSTAISPRYSGNTSFILLGSCTMHVHSRQPRHARMHLYKGLFSLTESLDKQKSKKIEKHVWVECMRNKGAEALHMCSNAINSSHGQSYQTSVRVLVVGQPRSGKENVWPAFMRLFRRDLSRLKKLCITHKQSLEINLLHVGY